MKRSISLCLALFVIIYALPFHAYAASTESTGSSTRILPNGSKVQTIEYADGSSLEIIISAPLSPRSSGTITGSKTMQHKDSSGTVEWKATLTATFFYTGSNAACTGASCAVTIYDSDWYVVSNSTSHSGNTATTQLTMGYKVLGITVYTHTYTITLSCDANGNLS